MYVACNLLYILCFEVFFFCYFCVHLFVMLFFVQLLLRVYNLGGGVFFYHFLFFFCCFFVVFLFVCIFVCTIQKLKKCTKKMHNLNSLWRHTENEKASTKQCICMCKLIVTFAKPTITNYKWSSIICNCNRHICTARNMDEIFVCFFFFAFCFVKNYIFCVHF